MTKKQKKGWLRGGIIVLLTGGVIVIACATRKSREAKKLIAGLKKRIQELEVENKMLVKDKDKLSNRVQSITYQLGSKVAQYENKSYS